MIVSLIAAATENLVIGKDGNMPWHMPDDLKYFMDKTNGHHVIMGRKTFEAESIPKPLKNRINIVISRNRNLTSPGVIFKTTLEEALEIARINGESEVFIIGGSEIYKASLPFADRVYLTKIHTTIEGDTFFPELDFKHWKRVSEDKRLKDDKNPFDYTFYVYERRK